MTKLNCKQQREHTRGVLLAMSYWENMRALVMPRWLFGYTVMLTSLRESFMGGEEREMARSRRERQRKFNIRKTSQQIVLMRRLYGALPNFTIKGKEEKARNGGGVQILAPVGVSRPGLQEPPSSRVYCPTRQINASTKESGIPGWC